MSRSKAAAVNNSHPAKTVAALRPGEGAVIAGYDDALADQIRVLEMGLTAGTPVRMVKRAPWGDPVQLFVRGYHLAISRKTAQAILVK